MAEFEQSEDERNRVAHWIDTISVATVFLFTSGNRNDRVLPVSGVYSRRFHLLLFALETNALHLDWQIRTPQMELGKLTGIFVTPTQMDTEYHYAGIFILRVMEMQ